MFALIQLIKGKLENRRRDIISLNQPRGMSAKMAANDWVPNRGVCIDACLSCDVTRSFRIHDIKALLKR